MKAHSQHTQSRFRILPQQLGWRWWSEPQSVAGPDPAPRTGNPRQTARPSASSHQRGAQDSALSVHGAEAPLTPEAQSKGRTAQRLLGWGCLWVCRDALRWRPPPWAALTRLTHGPCRGLGGSQRDPRLGCSQTPAPGGCRWWPW